MNPWETLTMSRKEAPRVGLLKALVAKRVTGREVAAALAVTVRQVWRLKRRFEVAGAAGLLHRSRGRPSPRRLPARLRQRVATLLTTTYRDFNDCHATEKLQEVEGLPLSRPTVRRLRQALGRPAKHRRRPRQYRARREPRARMGALVQLDASPFAWLEARGPVLHLHGAIDDATGTVLALHFRPTEDLHGYVTLLQQLGTTYTAGPWPSMAIASTSSSATIRTGPSRSSCAAAKTPRTSAASCASSVSGSSPRARRRPRAASNASGKRCKTASSASCGCAASPPSRRPTPSSPPSSPTSTAVSPTPPPTSPPPGAPPPVISRPSSAVATPASWPTTTPSASGPAGSNSPAAAPTPADGSRCASAW